MSEVDNIIKKQNALCFLKNGSIGVSVERESGEVDEETGLFIIG